jgi:DHA3 family macrolide efflux protein-like MFS transporter
MSVILLTDLAGAVVASITIAVVPIPELSQRQARALHFLREMKAGAAVYLQDKSWDLPRWWWRQD